MNLDWFLPVIKDHYLDFTGRTSKKSFWMYILYYIIIAIVLGIIDRILGLSYGLQGLFSLVLLLPSLGISARRLHDTGRSAWWLLLALTGIGVIVLIVFFVQDGEMETNEYGAVPVDYINNNDIR